MIDFSKKFQVCAPTQEIAEEIMDALAAMGYRWNSGDKLVETSRWEGYKTDTIYDVWPKDGGVVLYGSSKDPMLHTYTAEEFFYELRGEDDQELNIESLL